MTDRAKEHEYVETKTSLKPVRIRRFCQCDGEFKFTHSRTGIVTKFYHSCSACGKETWFDAIYPLIHHEEI